MSTTTKPTRVSPSRENQSVPHTHSETLQARPYTTSDSEYVCQCFRMTADDLEKIVQKTNCYEFCELRDYFQVGSRCTSCEIEIRDLCTHWSQQATANATKAAQIPVSRKIAKAVRNLKEEARLLARRVLRKRQYFGLFVVRGDNFESELVISNLRFPEDKQNANGSSVTFDTVVFDSNGKVLGERKGLNLPSDHTQSYRLEFLAPDAPREFHGTVLVKYYNLREKGALRPYCRLQYDRDTAGGWRGGAHYHDQYHRRKEYQHVLVTHPLHPQQTCYVALNNTTDSPYLSKAYLELEDRKLQADIHIPPNGAFWGSIEQIFGPEVRQIDPSANSYFWLESDSTVMSWYFWKKDHPHVWTVQHK